MWQWLDRLPLGMVAIGALLLGGAPFVPEPHLVEKLGLLVAGELHRPIDIFDLCLHGLLPVLLFLKIVRLAAKRA